MLAHRLAPILLAMRLAAALETAVVTPPPFRIPHHMISDVEPIGGGCISLPGEVSLAHHGILFLDELPEFKRRVFEALRQLLEKRDSRSRGAGGASSTGTGFHGCVYIAPTR